MNAGNEWDAKCAAWADQLEKERREGSETGLHAIVADLVNEYGGCVVLEAVSREWAKREAAADQLAQRATQLANVTAGCVRRQCKGEHVPTELAQTAAECAADVVRLVHRLEALQ